MLRTELNTTERGYTSFGYDEDALKHDSMYAHALVQAMGEWEANPEDWDSHYKNATIRIRARAAEIMRGFGYETDV